MFVWGSGETVLFGLAWGISNWGSRYVDLGRLGVNELVVLLVVDMKL
jgi:hypothetical protein